VDRHLARRERVPAEVVDELVARPLDEGGEVVGPEPAVRGDFILSWPQKSTATT
jgi:hypothetical protein